MFELKRILVPIDFSAGCLNAVNHAAALARHFHSQVTLLHVNDFPVLSSATGPLGFGMPIWEAARAEHLTTLRKELNQFGAADLAGISVKRMLCCGDTAKIIVDRAREEQSDLILMPTRGRGPFRRFLLGSITGKVLHDAECPVWTGAHLAEAPAFAPAAIGHVMCAIDFGPQSSKTIRWAAAFAKESAAGLTIVNAVLEAPPNLPDCYAFQWHEEARAGASQRLHGLLVDAGVQADSLVVSDGNIPGALSEAAQEHGAGLLVIGRNCADESMGRLGVHTYGIICRAPCPVVSI